MTIKTIDKKLMNIFFSINTITLIQDKRLLDVQTKINYYSYTLDIATHYNLTVIDISSHHERTIELGSRADPTL